MKYFDERLIQLCKVIGSLHRCAKWESAKHLIINPMEIGYYEFSFKQLLFGPHGLIMYIPLNQNIWITRFFLLINSSDFCGFRQNDEYAEKHFTDEGIQ